MPSRSMAKSQVTELTEGELATMLSQDPLPRPVVKVTPTGCFADTDQLRAWREAQFRAKS